MPGLNGLWSDAAGDRIGRSHIQTHNPVLPLLCALSFVRGQFQQLRRLDLEYLCQPADDLKAGVELALFQLAQIAPAASAS